MNYEQKGCRPRAAGTPEPATRSYMARRVCQAASNISARANTMVHPYGRTTAIPVVGHFRPLRWFFRRGEPSCSPWPATRATSGMIRRCPCMRVTNDAHDPSYPGYRPQAANVRPPTLSPCTPSPCTLLYSFTPSGRVSLYFRIFLNSVLRFTCSSSAVLWRFQPVLRSARSRISRSGPSRACLRGSMPTD